MVLSVAILVASFLPVRCYVFRLLMPSRTNKTEYVDKTLYLYIHMLLLKPRQRLFWWQSACWQRNVNESIVKHRQRQALASNTSSLCSRVTITKESNLLNRQWFLFIFILVIFRS